MSGKMGGFGKSMAGKGMGIAIAAELGAMGIDMARTGIYGENTNATGSKAMGVASSALAGAGMGAMIGSVVPVIGTAVGAIVGGLIGGVVGAVNEWGGPSPGTTGNFKMEKPVNDAIISGGKITPYNRKDEVTFAKEGGPIEKSMSENGGGGSTSSSVNVKISFDTLKLEGDNGEVGSIDLETDSEFIRKLASKVKEALTKTANGGVLTPNPA
jgi:hypothetical protein